MALEQNLDKDLLYLKNKLLRHQFSDIKEKEEKEGLSVQCIFDGKEICFILFSDIYRLPVVLIESGVDVYPHIIFETDEYLGSKWKQICLNIQDSYITYQMSMEEKIDLTVDKLLNLMSLSDVKIKKELEKEFSVYWQKSSKKTYLSNLSESEKSGEVRLLIPKDSKKDNSMIIVGNSYYNYEEKGYIEEVAYLINIVDFSDIFPPCYKEWDKEMINSIFFSLRYERYEGKTYNILKKIQAKEKVTILFKLPFVKHMFIGVEFIFTVRTAEGFLKKLKSSDYEVGFIEIVNTNIEHSIVRNGDSLLNIDCVTMIGCGSLGSYIYRELLSSNIREFILVDGDSFSSENLSRHILNEYYIGKNKAVGLQFYPILDKSVKVESIQKYLDRNNIIEVLKSQNSKRNLAIVTVGNEDVQHMINSHIYAKDFVPTLFCWLEANGVGAHVLAVINKGRGCYNCIQEYKKTSDKFKYIRNNDVPLFTNGCGGSYTHYGNLILLEATSLILNVIQSSSEGQIAENTIFSLKAIANSEIASTDYYNLQSERIQVNNDIYFEGCIYCGGV